jgi:hypothetical protein
VSGNISDDAEPTWGGDSQTLYYLALGEAFAYTLQEARLRLGADVIVENVDHLPEGDGTTEDIDVSPDGKTFYRVRGRNSDEGGSVRVVLNWVKELEAIKN